ncbi:Nop domain-containing protein [Saccharata proteae CBS 121410]|uniref:Nucleolar protein 58 n=1 Tax=Saccharata proteae CBS 121410 TaxID=1314787 RepID=A0A9P4HTF0_9PEZI|nr:Nop domain-containing protein [Saccharata proteae CBS 121410]
MSLFILTETSAGYALFKAKDKKLLKKDDLATEMQTAESTCELLKLKKFEKFNSAAAALDEAAALTDGKVTPMLSKILDTIKDEKKASLAVADPKLGNSINKLPGFQVTPISDSTTNDVFRAIREHLPSLITGLTPEDISTMSLGLSHSLSRHKLKFSADKVDTMIVQAISLLDDLDKELNMYAMRVKEWYGWHFPEMAKIINDNTAYSRVILKMGMRSNCVNTDLADILPEEIETSLKVAAEVSMGTEITDEDLENIRALAEQVVGFTDYRKELANYLTNRMNAIAPNLTALVGELVGARLIAHAGSLMNLAKAPGSTIQILGAEKALFRALKTKHDTPKYGLIYHASLIGQASGKNKGKIARMLASKAALGLRVDALSDWGANSESTGAEPTDEEKSAIGNGGRIQIEKRLRNLEGKPIASRGVAIGSAGQVKPAKFDIKEARKYNADADGLDGNAAPSRDTDGDVKMVEEVESSSDDSDDEQPAKKDKVVNGTPKVDEKAAKKAEKEAKKAEKEAKKARKAEREAKRLAKEAKKSAKEATDGAADPAKDKKRKRDEGESEKKDKKKKKSKA